MAPQLQPKPAKLRFGVFEADLNKRELFKQGARIRIQEQPFEILCILLERAGEVVSREELRNRLWPNDTFVEYEDSLNAAVGKLRAVLSDRFDQPRYIETAKRRGYRFIAPITPEIATILSPSIPPILSISAAKRQTGGVAQLIRWIPTIVFGLVAIFVLTRPSRKRLSLG
jgi:DNA-binding winged helix-turn-helix (wHTH) protein